MFIIYLRLIYPGRLLLLVYLGLIVGLHVQIGNIILVGFVLVLMLVCWCGFVWVSQDVWLFWVTGVVTCYRNDKWCTGEG